jgi:hypothetical protein
MNGESGALDPNAFLAYIWDAYEAGAILALCAWCGRVRIQEGQWVAPPPGALSTIDERMTMSHSICPRCAEVQPVPRSHEEPML